MTTKAISPKAKESLDKFLSFVDLTTGNEWQEYIEAGSLNLKLIASECGFSRSVVYQNSHVIEAVKTLAETLLEDGAIERRPYEEKLKEGVLEPPIRDRSNRVVAQLKEENRKLQNRVAELQGIVKAHENTIDKYENKQHQLFNTGRLPR